MTIRYEKQGRSVRLEMSWRGRNTIRLTEAGWAETSGETFACGPLSPESTATTAPSISALESIESRLNRLLPETVEFERLTIAGGSASHLVREKGKKRPWTEESTRLFVTIVRRSLGRRASLELGAGSPDKLDLSPVDSVCRAFAMPDSGTSRFSTFLRLESWITASLTRALADDACSLPGRIRVLQSPPGEARNAVGFKPRRRLVRARQPEWPDQYRPSYRFPPVAVPLHVDLAGLPESNDEAVHAVTALVSGWVREEDGSYRARAWVIEPEKGVALQEISVDPRKLARARFAGGGPAQWYPIGAGAWGRAIILPAEVAAPRSLRPARRSMPD